MEAGITSLTALVTTLAGALVVAVIAIAGAGLAIFGIRWGIRKLKSALAAAS